MAGNRGTHYEKAFEYLLQDRGITYVAVNQQEKPFLRGSSLKSFDYLIYPPLGPRLMVDVKGRKVDGAVWQRRGTGPTWVTQDDIDSLGKWEEVMGEDYRALLIFSYWLSSPSGQMLLPMPEVEHYQGRDYHFRAISRTDYCREMRQRSASWQTVHIPTARFGHLTQSFDTYMDMD